jgi:hypothetical protein
MAQVISVRQGDTKTLRLVIRTVSMEYLNLSSFSDAEMTLYTDPYDATTAVDTWSTTVPTEAIFYDPVNGKVDFYLTSSQTTSLQTRQYTMRVRLHRNANQAYTVYEGILEVKS